MKKTRQAKAGLVVAIVCSASQAHPFYVSRTGLVSVPHGSGEFVGFSLEVPSGENRLIEWIEVDLIIATTWQGDIEARVVAPSGNSVTLINRPGTADTTFGFGADHFGNPMTGEFMRFSDSASSFYDSPDVATPGITNVIGSWKPSGGSLASFIGEEIGGVWQLEVSDHVELDLSSINGFGIHAIAKPAPPPEPATLALLGIGSLITLRRRRL